MKFIKIPDGFHDILIFKTELNYVKFSPCNLFKKKKNVYILHAKKIIFKKLNKITHFLKLNFTL